MEGEKGLSSFLAKMKFYIDFLALTPLNKMVWLRKNIGTQLMLVWACQHKAIHHIHRDAELSTAVYLINRTPSKPLYFKTLLDAFTGHKPNYIISWVFGCIYFPYLRPYNKHKLKYRSQPSVFLGYRNTRVQRTLTE